MPPEFPRVLFLVLTVLVTAGICQAQSASQTDPVAQAASLLQKSVAAQTDDSTTTDVTLNGTISFLLGPGTDSGTVTFNALASGTSQLTFSTPSTSGTEVWSASQGSNAVTGAGPSGTVSEPVGGSVTMPYPAWFSPTLLTAMVSGQGYSSYYAGLETRNGASVEHVVAWQVPPQGSSTPAPVLRQQTQCDLYLDPSTSLPVSAVFQVWPYHPPGKPLSIRAVPAPEEVRYSNYQLVNGYTVPLSIQIYLGQREIIAITLSSATFNTGATITAPNP
jgi:hypothetical protein